MYIYLERHSKIIITTGYRLHNDFIVINKDGIPEAFPSEDLIPYFMSEVLLTEDQALEVFLRLYHASDEGIPVDLSDIITAVQRDSKAGTRQP